MKLTLTIETGNDACLTREDIARYVVKAALRIQTDETCKILDDNGQSVGSWEITGEDEWEVIVGTAEIVYSGYDEDEAKETYDKYVRLSQMERGRESGESILLTKNGEIESELEAKENEESDDMGKDEILGDDKEDWGCRTYNIFARDCKAVGLKVYRYHGRNDYVGPAVQVKDDIGAAKVIRCTDVDCFSDTMGKGLVIYPRGRSV